MSGTTTATTKTVTQRLVQGNEACAYGALYAGCDFYAGYPITPSSEVMEIMSREQPKRGGAFIQMEDEIASISAIIGASWTGSKAMTATSGPGFSLMQEGLGYACMTETPCVIVDSQRGGPSTGQPTKPAQGDVMQAIWGTHGDHPIVVLTASDVREAFEMTVQAFNISERFRVPVILLLDEVLSHMRENMSWPAPGEIEVVDRARPASLENFEPFGSAEFLPFGEGLRYNVTGLAHDGFGQYIKGSEAEAMFRRSMDRVYGNVDQIALYDAVELDDAEYVIVSYGITNRAAMSAVKRFRSEGKPVGLLNLKTLWPFPDFLFEDVGDCVKGILVPELNLGQVVREVSRAAHERIERDVVVKPLSRIDGQLITPQQIIEQIQGWMDEGAPHE